MRVYFAVGAEGVQLAVEHLHPRMRHGAARRDAEHLVRQSAGGGAAPADEGGAGTQNGGVCPLRAAGTEFTDRPSFCGAGDACRLGSDQRLMVDDHQKVGLNELRLYRRSANRNQRFTGEYEGSLRHRPHIAGKTKAAQVIEERLVEAALAAQKGDVLLGEMQVPDVVHDLLQSCDHGISAAVRVVPVEQVKVGDPVANAGTEVAPCHGQLVKVTEHGQVAGNIFHPMFQPPCRCVPPLYHAPGRLSISCRAFPGQRYFRRPVGVQKNAPLARIRKMGY